MTARLPQETVERLFTELRRSGSRRARAELIEHHLPLARNLARRYRYAPQPFDDLVQVASLGLVKAVDGFDPGRGTTFSAFAVPTIVGELTRPLRDSAWVVHVPRTLKEHALAVERAERRLSAHAAHATVEDLAREAGLSTEEVLEALAARLAHDAVFLDTTTGVADSPSAEQQAEPDSALEEVEDRVVLEDALHGLPARERTILRLRFFDGLTQSEIAERVGLSQVYISRLLRATLGALRDEID